MNESLVVLDVPEGLTETVSAVPGARRARMAEGAATDSAADADIPDSSPAESAGALRAEVHDVAQHTLSFSIRGTDAAVETAALATLLRNSLAHEATLHELARRLRLDVDSLLVLLRRAVEQDVESFTTADAEALRAANVDLSGPGVAQATVSIASRSAAQTLLDEALTVEQAADLLEVSRGRVRQRLASGELRGLRHPDGHTVIPRWQFRDHKVVPGLVQALASAGDLHPLVLSKFMATPSRDLALDDTPTTPIDWLVTGGEPAVVAELLLAVGLRG
jgi:excisionase family DNA binding protein